ncbi:uncharacterized protein LOC134190370 [Corticium candelabrum]|uniref:uncharacterized protein LOC134190370 n=1 Tax=Corticium candelabrum TaxID=121492 RepID=UPI002E266946|nr:uncharacterized protein LOC134190370 [Corticium candelabrum]
MADVELRLAFILVSCLLPVYDAAGDSHLINPNGLDCASFHYDLTTDTCCHVDCAGGTCRGPGPKQCVGKCGTWTEAAGPVEAIEGKGFYLKDEDVGTGSMTQVLLSGRIVVSIESSSLAGSNYTHHWATET